MPIDTWTFPSYPVAVSWMQVGYDFSLKPAIVEVDRDADRRWSFATDKMKLAEDKGETFSDSAPLEDATWDGWDRTCSMFLFFGLPVESCRVFLFRLFLSILVFLLQDL